jgi:hypothetical protein
MTTGTSAKIISIDVNSPSDYLSEIYRLLSWWLTVAETEKISGKLINLTRKVLGVKP